MCCRNDSSEKLEQWKYNNFYVLSSILSFPNTVPGDTSKKLMYNVFRLACNGLIIEKFSPF